MRAPATVSAFERSPPENTGNLRPTAAQLETGPTYIGRAAGAFYAASAAAPLHSARAPRRALSAPDRAHPEKLSAWGAASRVDGGRCQALREDFRGREGDSRNRLSTDEQTEPARMAEVAPEGNEPPDDRIASSHPDCPGASARAWRI